MKSDRNLTAVQAQPKIASGINPGLISGITAILVYAVTLGGSYVYDDLAVVRDDPRVHQPAQWKLLWTTDYFNGGLDNLYRPIVSSSYALEWFVHGNRPWIFHAVNILLHALACAGVAEFTRRMLGSAPRASAAALCTGLLFAVHPVHVEAVANIVGRAELACTTAIFAALIILCKRPLSNHRMIAVFLIGIVALLCKEQGMLQPLLWFIFGLLFWQSVKGRERASIRLLILITSWAWAIYILGREHFLRFEWDRGFMDRTVQPLLLSNGLDRVLMPVVLFGHYIALLIWPAHLSPDYGADVIGHIARFTDPYVWIGFAAIAIWLATSAWAFTTGRRLVLFCLLSFAIAYGLIGNIVTFIATIFGERLLYLPSAFFLILIGILIARLPIKPRVTLMVILVTLGSIRTFTEARKWNQPLVLFQDALATHPKSLQLRLLIAQQDHLDQNEPAAETILADAVKIYPSSWQAWMYRATQAMDVGRLEDAADYLQRARKLESNPNLLGPMARLEELKAAKRGNGGLNPIDRITK